MKVLVACEYSGIVRNAFKAKGHDAWSCDLLPTEQPSKKHIEGDVLPILNDGWDLIIAHPPCTHLSVSGAARWAEKVADGRQPAAIKFVETIWGFRVSEDLYRESCGCFVFQIKARQGYTICTTI